MSTTEELENELKSAKNIHTYISSQEENLVYSSLQDYLKMKMEEYGLLKKDVVKRSNLQTSYAYEILSGTKQPKRDKLIQLCFGFPFSVDEINRALQLGGYNGLYVRDRRDACIAFAAGKRMDIINLNLLLEDEGLEILE